MCEPVAGVLCKKQNGVPEIDLDINYSVAPAYFASFLYTIAEHTCGSNSVFVFFFFFFFSSLVFEIRIPTRGRWIDGYKYAIFKMIRQCDKISWHDDAPSLAVPVSDETLARLCALRINLNCKWNSNKMKRNSVHN